MLTVIETPVFQAKAAEVWSDEERMAFIEHIAQNPDDGDVIPETGGLRKIRWARAGMGKRGGARIIYFVRNARGEVVLLIVYTKAKFDNLPAATLVKLKEAFDG
jgi:hypothetical protein